MEQVCYNLLQNAAQAVFEQSTKTILFQTRVRGQRVLLKIQDYGIGIPKALDTPGAMKAVGGESSLRKRFMDSHSVSKDSAEL